MRRRRVLIVFAVSALLSLPAASTLGQLRGTPGGARGGGARIGAGGARGLSNPRSGLTPASNPIANPAPSLTPAEVLNPRGSLSSGQVINPAPSLNRPRSGGSLPGKNGAVPGTNGSFPGKDSGKPTVTANNQSAQPNMSDDAAASSAEAVPAGEQVLFAVVALDAQLAKVAPNKEWSERLSLDELRNVPAFSEQPAGDSQRKALQKIVQAYQAFAGDEQNADIVKMPEFTKTLEALKNYLAPIDVRRRRQAALSFQQFSSDLLRYKNGASWVEFLVPTELTNTETRASISNEQADHLLNRFDKLAGNRAYEKVTALPGFNRAHEALKANRSGKTP